MLPTTGLFATPLFKNASTNDVTDSAASRHLCEYRLILTVPPMLEAANTGGAFHVFLTLNGASLMAPSSSATSLLHCRPGLITPLSSSTSPSIMAVDSHYDRGVPEFPSPHHTYHSLTRCVSMGALWISNQRRVCPSGNPSNRTASSGLLSATLTYFVSLTMQDHLAAFPPHQVGHDGAKRTCEDGAFGDKELLFMCMMATFCCFVSNGCYRCCSPANSVTHTSQDASNVVMKTSDGSRNC